MEKSYDIWEMDANGKVSKGKRLITSDIFDQAKVRFKDKILAQEEVVSR